MPPESSPPTLNKLLPLPAILLLALTFAACVPAEGDKEQQPQTPAAPQVLNCASCHDEMQLDPAHKMACTVCHKGQEGVASQDEAHGGLITEPAHPSQMAATCGPCHPEQVKGSHKSRHFTFAGEVNTVRRAFGATESLSRAEDIPRPETKITTPLALADDLLRRRCLRCHIGYEGEAYPETRRGTGCAACHLTYEGGALKDHAFRGKSGDGQCLHCHNGNFVGLDYYGRFEHDLHWDYRTPYKPDGSEAERPYGVEYHQLAPDVHQQAGLACTHCHPGQDLMNGQSATSCGDCHEFASHGKKSGLALSILKGEVKLSLGPEASRAVPQLRHPAHTRYRDKAACAVCHAQWAVSDEGNHFFRQDDEEYDPWEAISVQGSFEVEQEVYSNINGDGYPYPFMNDKLDGKTGLGLWHKGYELRRWEFPLICEDDEGKLQVCRPILGMALSWVNEDGEVMMDNAKPSQAPPHGLLPYTPHTMGKAGPYFRQRLQTNEELLRYPLNMEKPKSPEK